jgi:hypothetical protein
MERMEPRHIDQRDEEVAEAPFGPLIPVQPLDNPKTHAALERYRRGRAALHRQDGEDSGLDPVAPIDPVRRVRDLP